MRKKVMIIINNSGGLYLFRRELIIALSERMDVVISTPFDEMIPELKLLNCRLIETKFNRRSVNPVNDISLYFTYLRILKEEHPDFVVTYTIKPNVYGGMACQLRKIPYVSNITGMGTSIENGGILAKISLTLYHIGIKGAWCVFFQNKYNKDFFINNHIISGKTALIPGSGVNINKHILEDYPNDDIFRFLFVGRVMKDKGIEELLNAVGLMASEGKDVYLDVVGGSDEDYSTLLSEYESRKLVKYHGVQKDVHEFYSKAHCVVLPSYHEGMSNVMLEAASTGRPVITSRIPGCEETFDEGITGYGCNPRDVHSLKAAMDKMYNTPWIKRKEMGLAGREKVKREFDRQIIVDAYLNEINNAISH